MVMVMFFRARAAVTATAFAATAVRAASAVRAERRWGSFSH